MEELLECGGSLCSRVIHAKCLQLTDENGMSITEWTKVGDDDNELTIACTNESTYFCQNCSSKN